MSPAASASTGAFRRIDVPLEVILGRGIALPQTYASRCFVTWALPAGKTPRRVAPRVLWRGVGARNADSRVDGVEGSSEEFS